MISLAPIIDVLAAKPDGFDEIWFRRIDGVAEGEQIKTEAMPMPACWIMRESEKSDHAGSYAELVTVTFNVVIGVECHRQHREPNAADEMMLRYRTAVKNRLLGFDWPDEHANKVNFSGGKLLAYGKGYLYWMDTYTVRALVTNYKPDPDTVGTQIERIIDNDHLL
nr:MAG TPA: hypothetical protein [Caudoviricetes sp.]